MPHLCMSSRIQAVSSQYTSQNRTPVSQKPKSAILEAMLAPIEAMSTIRTAIKNAHLRVKHSLFRERLKTIKLRTITGPCVLQNDDRTLTVPQEEHL